MLSGAKACKSCRSPQELSNEHLLAKFGFDTADNEPCKVCPLSAHRSPRWRAATRPCRGSWSQRMSYHRRWLSSAVLGWYPDRSRRVVSDTVIIDFVDTAEKLLQGCPVVVFHPSAHTQRAARLKWSSEEACNIRFRRCWLVNGHTRFGGHCPRRFDCPWVDA